MMNQKGRNARATTAVALFVSAVFLFADLVGAWNVGADYDFSGAWANIAYLLAGSVVLLAVNAIQYALALRKG